MDHSQSEYWPDQFVADLAETVVAVDPAEPVELAVLL
jgi:hypothetical protein